MVSARMPNVGVYARSTLSGEPAVTTRGGTLATLRPSGHGQSWNRSSVIRCTPQRSIMLGVVQLVIFSAFLFLAVVP